MLSELPSLYAITKWNTWEPHGLGITWHKPRPIKNKNLQLMMTGNHARWCCLKGSTLSRGPDTPTCSQGRRECVVSTFGDGIGWLPGLYSRGKKPSRTSVGVPLPAFILLELANSPAGQARHRWQSNTYGDSARPVEALFPGFVKTGWQAYDRVACETSFPGLL